MRDDISGGLSGVSDVPLPELPAEFVELVAINFDEGIITTDGSTCMNARFLTWVERLNSASRREFEVHEANMAEVAQMRDNGQRMLVTEDVVDQAAKSQARALLIKAAKYGAHDLHIHIRKSYTDIQIGSRAGLRVLCDPISHEAGWTLVRAIYQGLATLRDSSLRPGEIQNGQISGDDFPAELHLNAMRIVRGYSYPPLGNGSFMTIRLQYRSGMKPAKFKLEPLPLPPRPDGEFQLPNMGFTPSQIEKIRKLMDAPQGMVLFTGPTNSGKSTSLYEVLKEMARSKPHLRQVAVEEPIEQYMEWAVQMYVSDNRDDEETRKAFTKLVRTGLRMAPNIYFIGEIRTPEVAQVGIEATLTGHQVWSTLHTLDAFSFPERLEEMDPELLHRAKYCDPKIIRGVVAQRLIPGVCKCCGLSFSEGEHQLSDRLRKVLRAWGDVSKIRLQGPGCEDCNYEGFTQREALAEVIVTTEKLMHDYVTKGTFEARSNYLRTPDADPPMIKVAIQKVMDGKIDPRVVEQKIDWIECPEAYEEFAS